MTYAQLFHARDWKGIIEHIKDGEYENDVIVWTNLLVSNTETAKQYGSNNTAIMVEVNKAMKRGLKPVISDLYHVERYDMDILVYTGKKGVTVVIFKEEADGANGYI